MIIAKGHGRWLDLLADGRKIAGLLRDESGETVHLVVLDGRDAV